MFFDETIIDVTWHVIWCMLFLRQKNKYQTLDRIAYISKLYNSGPAQETLPLVTSASSQDWVQPACCTVWFVKSFILFDIIQFVFSTFFQTEERLNSTNTTDRPSTCCDRWVLIITLVKLSSLIFSFTLTQWSDCLPKCNLGVTSFHTKRFNLEKLKQLNTGGLNVSLWPNFWWA